MKALRNQNEHKHHPRVWRLENEGKKPHSPAQCQECQAIFRHGRWQWIADPTEPELTNATTTICPACDQINKRQPNGFLTLSGQYFAEHKDEILSLIRKIIELETAQHPLNRLMSIRQDNDLTNFTFTDLHLPKRIGRAIKSSHSGELSVHYEDGVCLVRWQR